MLGQLGTECIVANFETTYQKTLKAKDSAFLWSKENDVTMTQGGNYQIHPPIEYVRTLSTLNHLCLFFTRDDRVYTGFRVAHGTGSISPDFEITYQNSLEVQYPELLWLKADNVSVTQEGSCQNNAPIEYVRTLLTLKCLRLFFTGGEQAYTEFIAAQKNDPLSREAFDALHKKVQQLGNALHLKPERLYHLMEAALILGDMGKTETARNIFPMITAPDHDDFEKEALNVLKYHPSLCPTFASLSPNEQEILVKATGLAHFGHVYHLEGGPEMFSTIKESDTTNAILEFALFIHRCDVAGALGHINPDYSLTFTQTTYELYEAVSQACHLLLQEGNTELGAYRYFLNFRAEKMGLDISKSEDRVLTRIAAMLRLFTPTDGKLLQEAFASLSIEDTALIFKHFLNDTLQKKVLTSTYIPAVLLNLMGNPALGSTRDERLKNTINLGLPLIAKALEKFKYEMPLTVRACFNPLAGQAKETTAPCLKEGTILIDSKGNILVNLKKT